MDHGSEFPWHRPEAQNQVSVEQQLQPDFSQCHDPWMYYRGNIPPNTDNSINERIIFEDQEVINKVLSEYQSPQQQHNPSSFESNEQNIWHQSHQHTEHSHSDHQPSEHQLENNTHHNQYDYNQNYSHAHLQHSNEQQWSYRNQSYQEQTNNYHNVSSLRLVSQEHGQDHNYHNENSNPSHFPQPPAHDFSSQGQGQNAYTQSYHESGDLIPRRSDNTQSHENKSWVLHRFNEPRPQRTYQLHQDSRNRNQRHRRVHRPHLHTAVCGLTNGHISDSDSEEDYIIPRHPYDGFYLRHRPTIDPRGRKICMHEVPPTPTPSPPPESLPSLESMSVHSEDFHSASECEDQVSPKFPKHTRFTLVNTQTFQQFLQLSGNF